jgi:ZIP family zinc transporter
MMTVIVVAVVSAALIGGALWGVYGRLPERLEGLLIAFAGGALLISAVMELIEPALETTSLTLVAGFVGLGAAVFTAVDYVVDEVWGAEHGPGLLAATTLDGIPENLALGVVLIGAGPLEVGALAGFILLSNLPEAAGGAKRMADGHSRIRVVGIWSATAGLLALAAIAGNFALAGASDEALAAINCFAAGAVIASLATELFPKAFGEGRQLTGLATAAGLLAALALQQLGEASGSGSAAASPGAEAIAQRAPNWSLNA